MPIIQLRPLDQTRVDNSQAVKNIYCAIFEPAKCTSPGLEEFKWLAIRNLLCLSQDGDFGCPPGLLLGFSWPSQLLKAFDKNNLSLSRAARDPFAASRTTLVVNGRVSLAAPAC